MQNLSVNKAHVAEVAAEFLGTAVLVMVALVLSETTAVSYFIGTSVAVTFGVLYMIFNWVSDANFNPALTFGLWTARRLNTVRAVAYIVAQVLGAVAAWQLYQYFTNHHLQVKHTTFSTPLFIAEATGAFVLAVGFSAAKTRVLDPLQGALTAGASYFVGVLIAATAAAGYINPAVALGSRSFTTAYILGPLVGALIGVNLYTYLFAPATKRAVARAASAPVATSKRGKTTVTRRKK
jgi:glycerol uptake facilitator-like aquaporin